MDVHDFTVRTWSQQEAKLQAFSARTDFERAAAPGAAPSKSSMLPLLLPVLLKLVRLHLEVFQSTPKGCFAVLCTGDGR